MFLFLPGVSCRACVSALNVLRVALLRASPPEAAPTAVAERLPALYDDALNGPCAFNRGQPPLVALGWVKGPAAAGSGEMPNLVAHG